MGRQEFIDRYLGKAISKTFTVFIIATAGLFFDKLTGTEWTVLATVYIGSTKATEIVLRLKDKM